MCRLDARLHGVGTRRAILGSVWRVSSLTDVCFWHKADIPTRLVNVRYWGVKRILPEAAEAAPVLGLFNNSN